MGLLLAAAACGDKPAAEQSGAAGQLAVGAAGTSSAGQPASSAAGAGAGAGAGTGAGTGAAAQNAAGAGASASAAGAAPAGAAGTANAGVGGAAGAAAGSSASAGAAAAAGEGGGAGSVASGSAGAAGSGEAPIACPSAGSLKAGNSTHELESGGHMRSYLVHVPSQYTGSEPVPAVFDFHGYSSSAMGQMGASGFRELADAEGFIVVYPSGVGASWHVNGCCGQAGEEKLDEIAFVRAIVAELVKEACIDPKRVYATGISQGGGMAHHVGCLAADLFAGVAPVSSDLRTEPCTPAQPVTEISVRGMADSLSPYEGGHVGPPGMDGYEAIGAKTTLERWKTIAMCTGSAEPMDELCETYATCAGGAAVSLCSIPGADHVLYQNAQGFNVPKVAWELFKKHPR
ncbi:MAG: PHB depolymerase family esterase [Polyangiales bacterium]